MHVNGFLLIKSAGSIFKSKHPKFRLSQHLAEKGQIEPKSCHSRESGNP